MPYCVAVVT